MFHFYLTRCKFIVSTGKPLQQVLKKYLTLDCDFSTLQVINRFLQKDKQISEDGNISFI